MEESFSEFPEEIDPSQSTDSGVVDDARKIVTHVFVIMVVLGVVVILCFLGIIYYLLLLYEAGHWEFPKGNLEVGEVWHEASKREIELGICF